ncbi:hypothetical protein [Streptomyces sp. NPDC059861]|uniref:hypothetical protein n=1 Tax=Streptomyces sp. NPDC059861 TaxID=3346974 RepID=UPI003659884C
MGDSERHWVGAWHVPLNIAAMHVSGMVLFVGFLLIPAGSGRSHLEVLGQMIWFLMLHVVIQIPVGFWASRWAIRGQVFRAGLVALGLASLVLWSLYLGTGRDPSVWTLCRQSWGALCVSLTSYVWLCTLRRSTARRIAGRFGHHAQWLAMWALLRPPRRGPR